MFNERIQEVIEFTKSESPYRKANKGWINQDIFLDLSPSAGKNNQSNEAAKVTLFWSPINSLLSNIFLIIIACSILVFSSVSFANGRFNFNFFDNYSTLNLVSEQEDKPLDTIQLNDIDSNISSIKESRDTKDSSKPNKIDSLNDDLIKEKEKVINTKIDKQDVSIKDIEVNKHIKILKNTKSKSNFI